MKQKDWQKDLINYAEVKHEQARKLAGHYKRQGNAEAEVAWNHTAMAYSDMIVEIMRYK